MTSGKNFLGLTSRCSTPIHPRHANEANCSRRRVTANWNDGHRRADQMARGGNKTLLPLTVTVGSKNYGVVWKHGFVFNWLNDSVFSRREKIFILGETKTFYCHPSKFIPGPPMSTGNISLVGQWSAVGRRIQKNELHPHPSLLVRSTRSQEHPRRCQWIHSVATLHRHWHPFPDFARQRASFQSNNPMICTIDDIDRLIRIPNNVDGKH